MWLRRTFGDSLLTIKRLLGNCMVDPKSDDFVVIITGPSMSGKTTAALLTLCPLAEQLSWI